MQEILNGVEAHSEVRAERGWKLVMLLPRLLFFLASQGRRGSRKKLEGRIRQFQEGDWISLLNDSAKLRRLSKSGMCQGQEAGPFRRSHTGCPRHVVGSSWRIVCHKASSGRSSSGPGKPRHSESVDRSSKETGHGKS